MGKRKRDDAPRKDGRPKRTLVRWDPDLDIQLLLSIQAACNANQVKIPWDKVATTMGPKFTDGSIIQHLSKMRSRRELEGKPCPPPLRRSNTPAARRNTTSTAPRAPPGGRRLTQKQLREAQDEIDDDEDCEWEYDEDETEEETSQSTTGKEPDSEDEGKTTQEGKANKRKPTQRKPKKSTRTKRTYKHSTKRRTVSGLRPAGSAPEPTEDDDTGGNSNSMGDSEGRLCVGYPFLQLSGIEDEDSDAGNSPVEPEPTEGDAKPIAKVKLIAKDKPAKAKPGPKPKIGPKNKPGPKPKSGPKSKRTAKPKTQKIVRFKVPTEALRNLRDTGNVRINSFPAQTSMAFQQEAFQYDQQPTDANAMVLMGPPEQMTTGPEASTIQPYDMGSTLPPYDMGYQPFNMANFDYSQGGMTGPGPTYPPYDGDNFSAPPGWDPMAGHQYESPYSQQAGEHLLMEFIDPSVLGNSNTTHPYGEVPNWVGPDPNLFDEPSFDRYTSGGF